MTEQAFTSVWDAIEDDPAVRAGLKLRSELMDAIEAHLIRQGWRPTLAAKRLGITAERFAAFQRGQIDSFSIEDLLGMAASAGLDIHIRAEAAA